MLNKDECKKQPGAHEVKPVTIGGSEYLEGQMVQKAQKVQSPAFSL